MKAHGNEEKEMARAYSIWHRVIVLRAHGDEGLKQGKGMLFKATGDRFESSWSNDVRENKGVLVYSNGYRYEGEFDGETNSFS